MPGRSTMLRPSVRSMTLVSKFDGGRFLSWDGFGGETSHFRSRILYSFPGWLPSFAFAGPDCSSFDSWYISFFSILRRRGFLVRGSSLFPFSSRT